MAKLKIEGMPPHDGEYPLDLGTFKGSELHLIKQISGVRAGELQEALAAGDYDLVVAFAVIVLRRAGQQVEPETVMEADVGAITVDLETETVEEDERPLASSPTPNGSESSAGVGASSNDSTEPSGTASSDTGVEPPSLLRATGSHG